MSEVINEGYTITDRIAVGEIGFALGHNDAAPEPYVTWHYTNGANDFIWGHYFSNHLNALEDLCKRAVDEVRYQKQLAGIEDSKNSLPELCYCELPSTGEPIIVKREEAGYFPFPDTMLSKEEKRYFIDSQNALLGVTRAQESAMLHGSMFGWNTKGADPRSYDENGALINKRSEQTR